MLICRKIYTAPSGSTPSSTTPDPTLLGQVLADTTGRPLLSHDLRSRRPRVSTFLDGSRPGAGTGEGPVSTSTIRLVLSCRDLVPWDCMSWSRTGRYQVLTKDGVVALALWRCGWDWGRGVRLGLGRDLGRTGLDLGKVLEREG